MENSNEEQTWMAFSYDPNMVCVEDLPDHLKSILEYYGTQSLVDQTLTDLSPGNTPAESFAQLEIDSQIKTSVVSVSTFIGVNRMLDCSGVVLTKSGLILTSAKLLRLPSATPKRYYHIIVRLFNGEVLEAKEQHVDFYLNIAILKVQPKHPLEPIKLAELHLPKECSSRQLRRIWVLGREFFQLSFKQVAGVLLSHPPSFGCDGLLSTTCTIYQDCEGGPIITESGEVIGISFVDDDGFAHLLPSYCILSALMTWKRTRCVMYPWFGLTVIQANNVLHDTMEVLGVSPANKRQLLVKHVYSGCPADELKIRPGDRVISFHESKVFESIEYLAQLLEISRGMSTCPSDSESTSRVELEIQRQANDQTVLVAAEILPSTDRKLCICWPFREEIWRGKPLEGSQEAHVVKSVIYKPASWLIREQVQSIADAMKPGLGPFFLGEDDQESGK